MKWQFLKKKKEEDRVTRFSSVDALGLKLLPAKGEEKL